MEWETSVLIERDAADGIAALKNEAGSELQVYGSGNLIQTLMWHNLVGGATPVGHEDGAGLGGAEQRSKGFGHPSARRLAPDGHKRVGASEP